MKIAIDKIEVKYNPRVEFKGIKELAESIKRGSLWQPLTVTKNGGDTYKLLDGERRFRAIKQLKWSDVECYVVDNVSDEQQKAVAIETDLFKADLTDSERAIGIVNLIDKEKKHSFQTLAKAYGLTVRKVKALHRIGSKLHPKALEYFHKGQLDKAQAYKLTCIGREDIQLKLANEIAKSKYSYVNIGDLLLKIGVTPVSYEMEFLWERIKQDKKLGAILTDDEGYGSLAFCYDKKVYDEELEKYEDKQKKKISKDTKKQQANKETQKQLELKEKAERKKKREKFKTKQAELLAEYKETIESYFTGKVTDKDIEKLTKRELNRLSTDNNRAILKAFGVEFKASETSSEELKKMVAKIITPMVKTSKDLVMLITFVDKASRAIVNLFHPEWLKDTIKSMK